jgi:hypothetical protein
MHTVQACVIANWNKQKGKYAVNKEINREIKNDRGTEKVERQRQRSPKLQRTIIMVTAVKLLHVRSDSKEEEMPRDRPP